ncbi:MAG: Spo0B domain-containing protein [Treponema sp.]|nr:Spo0B domain-containing protein [Treponema sp.]
MDNKESPKSLHAIRHEIQWSNLALIILVTVLLSLGGAYINISANAKTFDQTLQNTAELISRQYEFTKELPPDEQIIFLDLITKSLTDVDRISIVNDNLIRLYHTDHSLIGKKYTGSIPDFKEHSGGFYTEDTTGPSGPQHRAYSELYDSDGKHCGFIMTIMLQKSIKSVTHRTTLLFLIVTLAAILIEIAITKTISIHIKKQFLSFAEDLEGTKFLVDSMRANNHDFTNKLHVILGLLQIGEYEKAQNYIENISIIQRETVSSVMHAIDNPSFAALLIGKIARACECNVRFILDENTHFDSKDIYVPSEALVTITGNLIDNALDAMNVPLALSDDEAKKQKELKISVMTLPGKMLITVKDNGSGISKENAAHIFDNGFSTKGSGRGVGLYHTKQLIESLGGSISFESQEGSGTCFMVILENKRRAF